MLGKGYTLLPLLVGLVFFAYGQHSVFKVNDGQDFHKVALSLESANGFSIIRSHDQEDVVAIFRDTDSGIQPAISEKVVDGIKRIEFAVNDRVIDCVDKVFFASGPEDSSPPYQWKVFLSKDKPIDLDLHYALGDAFLDLSDLDVQNLRIRSGHANVVVDHLQPRGVLAEMDSLFIDVDWGSIEVQNIDRTNVKNIRADIGFGTMHFDLSGAQRFGAVVDVRVGAGRLEVQLPATGLPVKVIIKDSPLCRVRLDDRFQKVNATTFLRNAGQGSAEPALVFNVNVGMGSVSFNAITQ